MMRLSDPHEWRNEREQQGHAEQAEELVQPAMLAWSSMARGVQSQPC